MPKLVQYLVKYGDQEYTIIVDDTWMQSDETKREEALKVFICWEASQVFSGEPIYIAPGENTTKYQAFGFGNARSMAIGNPFHYDEKFAYTNKKISSMTISRDKTFEGESADLQFQKHIYEDKIEEAEIKIKIMRELLAENKNNEYESSLTQLNEIEKMFLTHQKSLLAISDNNLFDRWVKEFNQEVHKLNTISDKLNLNAEIIEERTKAYFDRKKEIMSDLFHNDQICKKLISGQSLTKEMKDELSKRNDVRANIMKVVRSHRLLDKTIYDECCTMVDGLTEFSGLRLLIDIHNKNKLNNLGGLQDSIRQILNNNKLWSVQVSKILGHQLPDGIQVMARACSESKEDRSDALESIQKIASERLKTRGIFYGNKPFYRRLITQLFYEFCSLFTKENLNYICGDDRLQQSVVDLISKMQAPQRSKEDLRSIKNDIETLKKDMEKRHQENEQTILDSKEVSGKSFGMKS